ncbi:hypothetical protein [Polaribacter sp. Hel1_85]|uniref:hypothetical protein n=1 Tax=Polaribacter sp. Hel1_85 TaxID=1250005 RepID=UPI00052CA3A3|nr:hypothetical protein [Polaribacter sp. Hel1_85]KGL58978.1 hypothetical protein PHEL85_3251 [Polaribacter sp. Hel1_85]
MKIVQKFFPILFLSLFILSCETKCDHRDHEINDSRPSNAITYQEMADMFHQYDVGQKKVLDKYRADLTKNPNDAIETISHFYELDDLKQYIAYLEKLSKEKEIKLTGIRIFSAAYPKEHSDKSLRGRQTLVFMPTAKIGDSNGVAFEPLYSKKGNPIPFTKFLHQFSSKETRQVVRASFLPSLSPPDFNSSGANKLDPTPPM